MLARSEKWWEHRVLGDQEFTRRGGTSHRRVLHVRDGRPAGYVIYRTRTDLERRTTESPGDRAYRHRRGGRKRRCGNIFSESIW